MRKLKFRTWDIDDKQFIYAHIGQDDVWLDDGIGTTEMPLHHSDFEQYTGLKDKNGKEIYEGDILNDGVGHIGEVLFNGRIGAFVYEWGDCGSMFTDLYTSDIEVIGNIHENPELLKGGK